MTTREEIYKLVDQLPDDDLEAIHQILKKLVSREKPPKPMRSVYGALKDLGPAPSLEDIEENRRAMFRSISKEDV